MPPCVMARRVSIFLLVLFSCSNAPPVRAAAQTSLNGEWLIAVDSGNEGAKLGWHKQPPAHTEAVTVPHTWNIGKYDDHEGTVWYFKTFSLSEDMRSKRVEVHFGATFYKSRVWVNGVELGTHEGGHTAYFFDLTPHLRHTNFLAVEINNQAGMATIPGWSMKLWDATKPEANNIWYDWWHYGGIVRDVWLQINELVLVRRQQIRSQLEGASAKVSDRIFLENTTRKSFAGRIVAKAYLSGGGVAVASVEKGVLINPGGMEFTADLRIESVRPWHFDHPHLYRMEVELFDGRGVLVDQIADHFGCRKIEIRDRGLYLNGERVRLSGITRHEDSPWEGLAESKGTIQQDYDAMKDLQVTLTRPVHYPQAPAVLDYCDRNGILLIPEIPIWQFSEQQFLDPKLIALAQKMMREMVEEAYNHPSIFAWSVCNESATYTPGGRAYFKTMYEMLKSLDPDRYVSYADDRIAFVENAADNSASLADFIMMNQYFGTWHGSASELEPRLEAVGRKYPDKMVVISEFGAAGFFAPDSEGGDRIRSQIIRDQMESFGKYDWIGGAIFWCYQDYKSHRNLWPGEEEGFVEMGLVDENRQRRPSYQVWREENAPARVALEWKSGSPVPIGFQATISRRPLQELPSYDLKRYRVIWELRDADQKILLHKDQILSDIGAPQTVEASWPAVNSRSLRLSLSLLRPNGQSALEKSLTWWEPRSGGLLIETMRKTGQPLPQ